jgi:hypothetical protein
VSTTAKRPPSSATASAQAPAEPERCLACGAPLAEDQEWCLECGAARTLIHRPPDWRIGLAIMLGVVVAVLIVVVILWP